MQWGPVALVRISIAFWYAVAGYAAAGVCDPGDGVLTIRLDPLPTGRATAPIAQLCEHLTATQTRYPGTNLILRYEVKTRP